MNVYEKLNKARLEFQKLGVKQNGKNTFANYTYFELFDILPAVNKLAEELKFTCVIKFNNDKAILEFVDIEKPEDKIVFESPMSEASLKGCLAVQNLGAVESYIKRYLYQNCFEIAECDVVDRVMNPNDNKPQSKQYTKPTQKPAPKPAEPKKEPTYETPALELEAILSNYSDVLNVTSANGKNPYNEAEEVLRTGSDAEVVDMINRLKTFLSRIKK